VLAQSFTQYVEARYAHESQNTVALLTVAFVYTATSADTR